MNRFIIIAVTSLSVAIGWGGHAFAQVAKEVQFSGTHYYGHTPKVFKLDQDQMIMQFETLGVRVNDGGEGPFHEASVQIVGILYRGKDGSRLRGFETWTDKDGDKLVWEIMEKKIADPQPGTSPGTAKVSPVPESMSGCRVQWTGSYGFQKRSRRAPVAESVGRM
jgi:hypothetical protein